MNKFFCVLVAFALVGCNANGLTPQTQSDIAAAKANYCPMLQSVQDALVLNNVKLNTAQQTVVTQLDNACNSPAPITSATLAFYAADVAIVLAQISHKKKT